MSYTYSKKFRLAGLQFRSAIEQYTAVNLPINTAVVLVPEPTNAYDSNAIEVRVAEDDGQGVLLGYVPKTLNTEILAFLLDERFLASCLLWESFVEKGKHVLIFNFEAKD
jgi:hypothetical protein